MNLDYSPATLLVGDSGTGKTHALSTLLDVAEHVHVIILEQHATQVLANTPEDRFHWMVVKASQDSDEAFLDHLSLVNTLSYSALAKKRGINKEGHAQFIQIAKATMNFTCERCGKECGNWRDLGPNDAVAIDGLTELAIAAMELQVGSQPVKDPSDYGVAQGVLMPFLKKFAYELKCWRAMTAHPEGERDDIAGIRKIMPSNVGKALSPQIPKIFSNVVNTIRDPGPTWRWSTMTPDWVLSAKTLPWSDKIPPTFLSVKNHMEQR